MDPVGVGNVNLSVVGEMPSPLHSTFEMSKDTLRQDGMRYLLGTGEIRSGIAPHADAEIKDM